MAPRRPRVVVIGAGMAGILSAIKLKEAGLDDLVVYEKDDGLGGTWRANTYPGIACDVPSHLYSYSFHPNPNWSHVFSPGPEILSYLKTVAETHGVTDRIRLGTEVRGLRFEDGRWVIETSSAGGDGAGDNGRTIRTDTADVVIAATGVLHHPSYPDIEGIEEFDGPVFHSARWDHTVELSDKRIGVMGTGSSAVQIVSSLADRVKGLTLFQRTAQWVVPIENPPIDDDSRASYQRDPDLMRQLRSDLGRMFEDNFANAVVDADSPQIRLLEKVCRANLEDNVGDPRLRERLRPEYRAACKRLIVSPNFYQAIQHPNASLVTESIERIEPKGVRTADGTLHEIDVLVLATGFRVDRFMRPMHVTGRGGADLDDMWSRRPYAYLSISIPDFPNLFMLNGPNGPVGNFSLIDVAELQFGYILQLLELITSGRCTQVSATHEATEVFEQSRTEAAKGTVWMTGCRSWYLDDRGIPAVWPWSFDKFRTEMSAPKLDDYELAG
jgi:cation diffusion facilitator CzcD-associated flavoprotein CzcO